MFLIIFYVKNELETDLHIGKKLLTVLSNEW